VNHRWELQKREAGQKVYACGRCGAGPVRIMEAALKGSITQTAKRQGVDADCKMEIVKGIHKL
jgi:hypothetical protein